MAHVHYKFSSKLSYDTLVFDGPHTTLSELKREIMCKEKLRAGNCDLHITNAQTKEEYTVDDDVIPKGSSVIVRRIPTIGARPSSKSKANNIERSDVQLPRASGPSRAVDDQNSTLSLFSKMTNLADVDVPEEDKLKVMMSQSVCDSMNLTKKPGNLPESYTCYRCGLSGHHIRNCPTIGQNPSAETPVKIKKSTGIPRSFMVEVDDPGMKGAMLTSCGRYAIPVIDAEAYAIGKKEKPLFSVQESESEEDPIPDELLCLICRDLLCDSVVIPCCGNSYCDDCIRTALLDSEDHVCPTCGQSDVSPDTLIANKFLRQAVNTFKKERGYASRKQPATSQSQNLNPTPKPVPTLPPLSRHGRQQRPQRSHLRQQESLRVHPEAAKTPPLSQVCVDPPTATCPVSAHGTASLSAQSVHDSQEIAVKEDSPSSHDSSKDQITSPSQLTPPESKVNSSSVAERPQAVSMDQEMPSSSSGHSKPSTSLDNSSSSAGCTTGNWNEPIKQQQQQQQPTPPSPFPLSVFHTNLPPPGYPAATPIWTPTVPQGSSITSLCSSAPAVHKEWYGNQIKERPSHRTSRNRCSSSHSKSKSSQSFSHSSSRSESRSRSRSKDRSRHRCSNSRRRDHYSRSSCSYTFGYKRSHSPTPSSSSSPRSGYQSKSRRDHRRSRHDSKSSSSSSRRRADRSRRDPAGTHLRAEQKKQSSSLELDRERYMQWKKEYTEWCEKYLSSYVSHFHQLPFAPLLGPPPACPQWEEKDETNRSQASSSHHQTQERHATRRDGQSSSSDSSSCSSSSPSHSSSENHSTPFQSPSRSSLSHKNSSCRSPPSQSSNDGLSAQSEDRNQTGTHESSTANNSGLPVTHMKRTEGVDDRPPTQKSVEESDLLNHEQKETKTQEVERRERSSSPAAAADSKAESQDNKSLKTEIPISGSEVSNTRDALESSLQLPTPGKSRDKNHERKAKKEKNLEKEKVARTDKDSQSGRVEDGQHSVKPSEEADLVATDKKESSESRRGHDTRSARNRRCTDRERNDRERSPAVKHQSSKCHKTETSQDPESRRSESPKPLERKKQKKESTLLWTKEDIWEKGIKVKPQKKINININLDVKRKDESIDQQDLSNLESIKEKTRENTEHVLIEEETFNQAQSEMEANGKTETGREEKTEEATKPEEAIWDQTFFTNASIEMLNQPMFGDENEDLSLWHCALKSAEEMDDITEAETVSISHQDQVMEELISSLQTEEENPFKKNGGETTMEETNAWGEDSNAPTPQTSKNEIQHEPLTTADSHVNPAVDRCGAEESQERRSLPEKSQGRAADGQNEQVLMQVFRSKREREEEEEQDEGEVGVHTDTPPVALSQPALTVNIRPTETGDGQQEQRSAEMGRDQDRVMAMGKDQEAQRHCNLSASKRDVSPSSGKDQTSSPLYSHRDHNQDRERRTEEERKTSKEHKREKEKVRNRDREVERSSSSSAQKRKHSSSHSSTSHNRERGASHRSSSSIASRHSSTGRRSADLPDHNPKKSLRDTSPAWKSSHQDPSRTYRHQPRSAGTHHSSPPVSHRHSKDRDLLPLESSAESADRGWMQSKNRNESKTEKKEREPNKVDKTKIDGKSRRDHRDISEPERVRKREEDVFYQRDGTTKVGKR
ncbi:E3 ubiquitin-protein ligase RBBP6-like [Salarias fasciatus]|uniref:E3 ubiquitin-protein ligase RBBP6-like n=1 Tax=Salarias fasciatus TaxID=181472 RepID=UPI0011767C81|nr:E3 ubiquitin-protein ligase RBBP6 [Salarias fasciatus]